MIRLNYIKSCTKCGVEFTPSKYGQITCNDCGCVVEFEPKECTKCGKEFTPKSHNERVCVECKGKKPKVCKEILCSKCGSIFTQKTHKQIVCELCKQNKPKKVNNFKLINCTKCGVEFIPKGSTQKTCESCKPSKWVYDSNRVIPCIVCGKEFNPISKNNTKCSKECCRKYAVDNRRENRNRDREDKFKNAIEGLDYIKCEICGCKAEQLHATHFSHVHNISTEEYLELYPNARLVAQKHIENLLYRDKNYNSMFVSKVSLRFISNVINCCKSKSMFLYGNSELKLKTPNYYHMYDLTNTKTKRIIEFNGDFWHCNPSIYSSDYFHKKKKMHAIDIWDRDNQKIEFAKSQGYEVMVIWEKDFKSNPEDVIKKCREFIL